MANKARRCGVCGQTVKLKFNERMRKKRRALPIEERRAKRAKRRPLDSVHTVSGGLPGLGRPR